MTLLWKGHIKYIIPSSAFQPTAILRFGASTLKTRNIRQHSEMCQTALRGRVPIMAMNRGPHDDDVVQRAMSSVKHRVRQPAFPLAVQIQCLLVSGLIVAQLVTLLLTLVLPPAPQRQYQLYDIAAALNGRASDDRRDRPLLRMVRDTPPVMQGPGWLTSEKSRQDLARMLDAPENDVLLAFYTPLPFAGVAVPRAGVEAQPVDRSGQAATSALQPIQAGFFFINLPGGPGNRPMFGLAPAPFIQGDFIAARRLVDGRWAMVQLEPEAFPNSWQRRVLLWFVVAFAVVAPFGFLFARRIVTPLTNFAAAAEQLGRDPSAPVMTLTGPAEVGRAARAFNQMQDRLRRFVDDRTAMIGAISHELRTPLTRMRFWLEEAPDQLREGVLEEVVEMEEMITSVLLFLRDVSEPALRETADLRSILENVVDGTTLIGGKVTLEPGGRALVVVDALGIRRALHNLVDNAVKYGERAYIRLFTQGGEDIAEISDDGPGLSDTEIHRVFKPFYRSETAHNSEKQGIGLGLAACRSIARAHGGDVSLLNSADGLIAQIRLPLAEMAI